jgi:hypothetical protein
MWTLAFGHHEDRTADARLWANVRGSYGGVREELAVGLTGRGTPSRQLGNGGLPRPRA